MTYAETMTVPELVNAYYLAYEAGLVASVNLNGHRSSNISQDALVVCCEGFPSELLQEAKVVSQSVAFSRYEAARLAR